MSGVVIGIRALTLTPFSYHSLMTQGGTATIPEVIGDCAVLFALSAALGHLSSSPVLPSKDYRRDLGKMRWRASVFETGAPVLLPPVARRLNLEDEGGYNARIQKAKSSGNYKDFFFTQEVPPGIVFRGAVFGVDPFEEAGLEEIVIRIGLHRNGMVRLVRDRIPDGGVRLNASTARLFGRDLPVERYLLDNLQLTPAMMVEDAWREVSGWRV